MYEYNGSYILGILGDDVIAAKFETLFKTQYKHFS